MPSLKNYCDTISKIFHLHKMFGDKKLGSKSQVQQKTDRRAASLAASLISAFSVLFFWITSNVAPTMDLE